MDQIPWILSATGWLFLSDHQVALLLGSLDLDRNQKLLATCKDEKLGASHFRVPRSKLTCWKMNAALWKVQRVLGVAVVYLRKRQKAETHANGLRISKSHNLKIIFAHLGHVRDERAHPYLLGGQTIATQAMRHTHSILLPTSLETPNILFQASCAVCTRVGYWIKCQKSLWIRVSTSHNRFLHHL